MQPSQDRRPSEKRSLPRRRRDLIEDATGWVLTTAGLFAVLLSAFAGVHLRSTLLDQDRANGRDRTQVEAVLADDPPQLHVNGASSLAARTARYTDAAGQGHEVVVTVDDGLPPGSAVPVWVDHDGTVTGAPITEVDAAVVGAAFGLGVAAGGVVLLVGAWRAVRWELDRRNTAAWADEWARVQPGWSGRSH